MMALIPAWAWRWLAILGVGAALYGMGWLQGRHHEELIFDDYKEQVKLAADKQNFLTAETIKAHKSLQELSDAEAKTAAAERDAATLRLRQLVQAGRDRSLLSAIPPSAAGNNRVCFATDQLDRGLRQAVGAASDRLIAIAEAGQRGVDTAVTCQQWAKGF